MNMDIALATQSQSIGMISKQNESGVRMAIANMIKGTSMYFDTQLQDAQADIIAEEILGSYEYRQLKLEDIWAICTELKEKDIIKLTPARILSHIRDYMNRRIDRAIQMNQQKSDDYKQQLGESNIDDRVMGSARLPERSFDIVVKNRLFAKQFK